MKKEKYEQKISLEATTFAFEKITNNRFVMNGQDLTNPNWPLATSPL